MLRSIGAVVAGFVVLMVLVMLGDVVMGQLLPDLFPEGQPAPTGAYLLTMVSGTIYGIIAGYLTGLIARRRQVAHALVIAAILWLVQLATIFATRGAMATEMAQPPAWYLWGMPIIGTLGLWLGAWLQARGAGKQAPAAPEASPETTAPPEA